MTMDVADVLLDLTSRVEDEEEFARAAFRLEIISTPEALAAKALIEVMAKHIEERIDEEVEDAERRALEEVSDFVEQVRADAERDAEERAAARKKLIKETLLEVWEDIGGIKQLVRRANAQLAASAIVAAMQDAAAAPPRQPAKPKPETREVTGGNVVAMVKPQPKAAAVPPSGFDIFAGAFDDWVEAKEPGWKAKKAADRAEKAIRDAEERAAALAKYGSEEAVKAPCERERTLNAATAHLAGEFKKTYANGTFTVDGLDGWSGGLDDAPASVIEAVSNAMPMPTTIREAKEEHEYWEARDREIDAVYGSHGNRQVGLAAAARWEMVRKLYERDLPILSVDDLHARLQFVAASDWIDDICDAMPSLLEAFARLVVAR